MAEEMTAQEEALLRDETPVEKVETPPEQKAPSLEELQKALAEKDRLIRSHEAATREERALRKETIQRMKTMEERFEQLATKFQQPEKQVEFTDDPLLNLKTGLDATKGEVAEVKNLIRNQQSAVAQQGAYNSFISGIANAEAEFIKTAPDYKDAVEFLRDIRITEMEEIGISREEAVANLNRMELQMAKAAFDRGRNPAQAAYNMAKKMGYSPKKEESEAKLQNVAEGQAAAKTVSSGVPNKTTSLEEIAKLPQDEFERLYSDEKAWKRLFNAA